MKNGKKFIGRSTLFGPVPSRRLGMSLGIDLVPPKTCSMDCVYCESGPTTLLTTERREFVPTEAVIDALREFLTEREEEIDYVTFSGAGEPTLHSGIGRVARFLSEEFPRRKTCLLTNATPIVSDKSLLEELNSIHLLVPSLDAATPRDFAAINRPAPGIDFEAHLQAVTELRRAARGEFHLEIFVVPGINDSRESIDAFAEIVENIKPDKTLLNTLDRPGTESWVVPASAEKLAEFADAISHSAMVEITARSTKTEKKPRHTPMPDGTAEREILEMTTRRPCTEHDLARSLGMDDAEIARIVRKMSDDGKLEMEKSKRGTFMRPARQEKENK